MMNEDTDLFCINYVDISSSLMWLLYICAMHNLKNTTFFILSASDVLNFSTITKNYGFNYGF